MKRPADAVVTGFTKSAELCERSLAPLRQLKQEGVLRDIHYVTWSSPDLDRFLEPVLAMDDVKIVRVPQPHVTGSQPEKTTTLQSANLAVALDQIEDANTLVVKSRPDYIFATDFLRNKICNFDTLCAIPSQKTAFGVKLPKPPFAMKIWLPWAEANCAFYHAEMAFIGLKRDVSHLVTPDVAKWFAPIDDPDDCYIMIHAVRFAAIFVDRFPIFRRYMRECMVFRLDTEYSTQIFQFMLSHPFFWCLIVANAWILYQGFHIDCGAEGDMVFYPSYGNQRADWSDLSTVRTCVPYDNMAKWNDPSGNGTLMYPIIGRRHNRLLDDNWQRTMFTGKYSDFSMSILEQSARLIASYPNDAVKKLEDELFEKLWHWYRAYQDVSSDMDDSFASMRIA